MDLLRRVQPKRILDVGCGSGGPLLEMLRLGFDASGFDYAPEMVEESQRNLREAGFSENKVHRNNIEDIADIEAGVYDCITALGVIYYARNLDRTMSEICRILAPGGRFIFSVRNSLFSLFSLNEYSYEFFTNQLIPSDRLSPELRENAERYMAERFASVGVDRKFKTVDDLGIHSREHNPLTVSAELLQPYGLTLEGLYFYHWHAVPPIFEHTNLAEFRDVSAELENPTDWRGMFMASGFVVDACKTP